tara:strand:- start:8 stop:451 length:444 start_codon:yes stop_codon:yes gene_type:complete
MAYSVKQRDETFNRIIKGITDQGKSLRGMLLEDNMPSSKTFYIWLESDEEKVKQYARACEDRQEKLLDEILQISDNKEFDTKTVGDGAEVPNHEWISRSKLKVDSRKWLLGKLNPKKYGNTVDITSGGDKIKQQILSINPLIDSEND